MIQATRHETVSLDAAQGVMEFEVQYHRVEAVLDRLAKSGVGEFLAHIRCTKDHDNEKVSVSAGGTWQERPAHPAGKIDCYHL